LKARKRAKLSKILQRIGIVRRASGTKGPKLDEKVLAALHETLGKLVKDTSLHTKYGRQFYDSLLKIAKATQE